MILQLLITSLLFLGAHHDWKCRHVPNPITFTVFLLAIPLIYLNWDNITSLHILTAVLIMVCFFIGQAGGADTKVLIPIVLSLTPIRFFFFLILLVVGDTIVRYKYRKETPMFLAIAPAYFLIGVL